MYPTHCLMVSHIHIKRQKIVYGMHMLKDKEGIIWTQVCIDRQIDFYTHPGTLHSLMVIQACVKYGKNNNNPIILT